MLYRMAIAAAALVIAGCGGGSDVDAGDRLVCSGCTSQAVPTSTATTGSSSTTTAAGTPEGYWEGTATGGYSFGAVILEDGRTFVAYGASAGIEGLMVGSTTASGSNFSGLVTDYNGRLLSVTPGRLTGAFGAKSYLNGVASIGSRTVQLTATYNIAYDTAADLAEFAGTWSGTAGSVDGISHGSFQISADGSIIAFTAFCTASGTASPIKVGKHPLGITVAFSGANCPLAGKSVTGVAVVSQAGARKQLIAAGLLPDQSDGFFALATK